MSYQININLIWQQVIANPVKKTLDNDRKVTLLIDMTKWKDQRNSITTKYPGRVGKHTAGKKQFEKENIAISI